MAAIDYALHSNVTGINPRKRQHFLRRQFTQRIRCDRTVAGEKFTVLMYSPGDVVINDVHAHFLQFFAEVP